MEQQLVDNGAAQPASLSFQTDDGISLSYSVQGEGFPLLLVNGLGNLKEAWGDTAQAFSRYFKVICYDLRNQGKDVSNHGIGYDFNRHVADLKCLISTLKINSFCGIGISTGSRLLADYAVQYPAQLQSLVLMGVSAERFATRYQVIFESWLRALRASPEEDLTPYVEAYLPWIYGPDYLASIPANFVKKVGQLLDSTMNREGTAANIIAAIRSYDFEFCSKFRSDPVRARTLILQGELDFMSPPRCVEVGTNQYTNSIMKIIPRCGHNIRTEQKSVFEKESLNFFLDDPDV